MKLIIFVALSLFQFTLSADHSLFKTCEQSSFCRRCRNVNGPTKYEVLRDTLQIEPTRVIVELRNNENQRIFLLKLGALEDNKFHFEIDEKSPLKPRYRVTEALKSNPTFIDVDVTSNVTSISVKSKSNEAVILLSPFEIHFFQNKALTVKVNAEGLLRFEHLQTKPATPEPNEEPGSWEEIFTLDGTDYVDTKPNGPEAVAIDFTFPQSEILFGIPQHADSFALKPTVGDEPYRLYTLDVTGYELDSRMPTYGAIPVIYSHKAERTAGIFWHNSADTFVDIHGTTTAHFISEAGIIDVFVLLGPSPNEVFSQYTQLTGVTNLPQLYTLAYHQSRWNYESQQDVLEVVSNFDKASIPLDTMWLDIEYTDGKRYFTWDYEAFPQPLQMIQNLTDQGRHLTYIIDPHIKKDPSYFFYAENKNRGFFVKDKDGNDYEGSCWPGMSSYVDFFNPEARRFYADQYLLTNFKDNAVDTGIWNDMNEPVVFDVPEKTFPRDNLHYGGVEHRNVHSLYGLMQTKGTFDGLMRRANGNLRPFILTRSFFAGTQRYSAVWTGDNTPEWGYLEASVKMCLSISAAGISFCGSDIGGFFDDPEQELLVRWYQAAAYQPFFRSHAMAGTKRREPFLLPEDEQNIVRKAINDRYALMPFWYTIFYEHEIFGTPVMQPMLSQYPKDSRAFKLDDQYMLSDKMLIRPVMTKGVDQVTVYFPSTDGGVQGDRWYRTETYTEINTVGPQNVLVDYSSTPVYQRGGTIIPRKETLRTSTVFMRDDPISLFVALDKSMHAKGTLYIDDEMSYDYRRGNFLYVQFEFINNTITNRFVHSNFQAKNLVKKIVVIGLDYTPTEATFETSLGEKRNFTINKISANHFEIEVESVNLLDEWKIEVINEVVSDGAIRNVFGFGLLVWILLGHVVKNFMI